MEDEGSGRLAVVSSLLGLPLRAGAFEDVGRLGGSHFSRSAGDRDSSAAISKRKPHLSFRLKKSPPYCFGVGWWGRSAGGL